MNITHVMKCQLQCGPELEQSTATPPRAAPQSSDSERNISLTSTCQSQGGGPDLGRRMATPTLGDPLSSALAMSTPVKTCPPHVSSGSTWQSEGGAGHERDTLSGSSPHFSEMNITHVMKCQLQCGPELECSTATPPRSTHLASAFAMLTSAKTCQAERGAALELDNKDTPVVLTSGVAWLLLLLEILCPLL
jgi:hypothetical protein